MLDPKLGQSPSGGFGYAGLLQKRRKLRMGLATDVGLVVDHVCLDWVGSDGRWYSSDIAASSVYNSDHSSVVTVVTVELAMVPGFPPTITDGSSANLNFSPVIV